MANFRFAAFISFAGVLLIGVAHGADDLDTIFIRLYTGKDSHIDEKLPNATLLVPKMNSSRPTVLYIHGYTESVESGSVGTVVDAYKTRDDHNIMALDYRVLALKFYTQTVADAEEIAEVVADAIEAMVGAGLDQKKIHIVGHSLGAQVAGYIGYKLSFQLTRISGLDPAGPLYNFLLSHLTSAAALFVDVIHTDRDFYGTVRRSGTVDFYPNDGHRVQPGCPKYFIPLTDDEFCSHHRSWQFYAESVVNATAFPAVKCEDYLEFTDGDCDGEEVFMGYGVSLTASGKYYLRTGSSSPFGLGEAGTTPGNKGIF